MQGISTAEWQTSQLTRAYTAKISAQDPNTPRFPGILPAAGEPDTRNLAGRLKVMTTGLRPRYARNNGAPYSANALPTEYYDGHQEKGVHYLLATQTVDDPQ